MKKYIHILTSVLLSMTILLMGTGFNVVRCMLDDDSRNNPSKISIAFFIDDIRYTYNISVSVDSIIEETLIMHGGETYRLYS